MAVRDGVASSNLCLQVNKLREENRRTRYLTLEEEVRLLVQCVGDRAHLRPIVILAIQTGMRRGEILSLTWQQVDFERGLVHLTRTKSGNRTVVPINWLVRDEMLGMPRSTEYVFASSRREHHLVENKRACRAACREAGVEDMHFHDLRHTAATRWVEGGAPLSTIADLLGHADLRMTARYTHATDQSKRRAVEQAGRLNEIEKAGHNVVTMKKREA